MKCPKCGVDVPEGVEFCGGCGFKVSDAAEADDKAVKEKAKKKSLFKKKTRGNKESALNSEKGKGLKFKWLLIAIAVAAVIIAVLLLIAKLSVSPGEKIVNDTPLGRDIGFAETKAGAQFTTASRYSAMKSIGSFDYVYESDKGIKVDGIHFPEWAVMIKIGTDNTINNVAYYDFSQLQKSWKGSQRREEIPSGTVIFGMKANAVEKALGMKPYTIKKDIDNTSTYVYRYCYPEAETGNIIVCNYYVVFNDIDGTVKDVHSSVVDYCSTMIKIA